MESYSNLCRLCLVTERNGVDLFKGGNSNKYSKELTEFFRIEDIPGWPQIACLNCIDKLREFMLFKSTISTSQEKLIQLLANIRIKCEPVEIEELYDETGPMPNNEPPTDMEIISEVWIKEEIYPKEEEEHAETPGEEIVISWDGDSDSEHRLEETRGKAFQEDENDTEIPGKEIVISWEGDSDSDYRPEADEDDQDISSADEIESAEENYDDDGNYSDMDGQTKEARSAKNSVVVVEEDPKFEKMLRDLNVLQCQPCKRNFTSFTQAIVHEQNVHENKNRGILCCGSRFYGRADMYDHMRYHLNEDAFKCGKCEKNLFSGRKLKLHKLKVHPETRFDCKKCGKVSKTVELLRSHMKTHMDPAKLPLKCPKCDKRFLLGHRLRQHLNQVHTDPVNCEICGKMVVKLDCHMRWKHPTTDQMKMCKFCKKDYPAIHLSTHINNVHRDQRLPCQTCGKKFKSKSNLNVHTKRVHSGIRVNCPFCPLTFSDSSGRRYHLLRNHLEEQASENQNIKGLPTVE